MLVDPPTTNEIPQMNDAAPEIPVRRSQRQRRPTLLNDYHVYLGEADFDIGNIVNPMTFKEALNSDQADKWLGAMKDEMISMSTNQVWKLVDLPDWHKSIDCKLVFKTKKDNKGNIKRFKARLVVNGYTQS